MKLTLLQLKKMLPEINRRVITPARILQIFRQQNIEFCEIPMEGLGGCVSDTGREYVFLRNSLPHLLYHETLSYEGVHALSHHPAPFLRWRHDLEAEVLSLVFMMPLTDLPRLNRIKHQLDEESYELLERRNKANAVWRL